mmetsp:Transcript_15618/g.33761  ORF Transcript_15618/g.33761 Transcript_15618/m.33761 type:complete len:159 (-) Transcript_15618:187-663(-)
MSQLCETIEFFLDQTNLEANPTADGDNRSDGSSGSINDEGQLLAGNAKRVEDGKHGLANDEAVGVIVEEDETAGEECGEKAGARSFGASSQTVGKALDATTLLHDGNEASQEQREQIDVSMPNISKGFQDVFFKCELETTVDATSYHACTDKDAGEEG